MNETERRTVIDQITGALPIPDEIREDFGAFVADTVMGGVSQAHLGHELSGGRPCLRLRGDVSLENNGGFVQAVLDLSATDGSLDASSYRGLRLTVCGNGEDESGNQHFFHGQYVLCCRAKTGGCFGVPVNREQAGTGG